ncbi:MAG: hypothetical protein QM497_06000 [Sulfurimonas sp.]
MPLFLELEGPYMVIGVFFMLVALFVTTRDFMPRVAFKRGMIGTFVAFSILIAIHFSITTSRMNEVKKMFNNDETIICENKMRRTISQSILISKKLGWRIEKDLLKSDDYVRDFHVSRCVEYIYDK